MVSNEYIKDFLINYWDCHGSLDGLSKNAKRIYSLIQARRKNETESYGVNDYIYHSLGMGNIAGLGEELTFEINNHLAKYNSLKNVSEAPFYSKLQKAASKRNTSVESMLLESGCEKWLNSEVVQYSYQDLNLYYMVLANVLRGVLTPGSVVFVKIQQYWLQHQSFSSFIEDEPKLTQSLLQVFHASYDSQYTSEITNADAVFMNGKFFVRETGREIRHLPKPEEALKEALYYLMGFIPVKHFPPSLVYALKSTEARYKSLYNLHRNNPRLYQQLKSVYLMEDAEVSLRDLLNKEGFYYPELNNEPLQYLGCSDKQHLICVSDQNDYSFIVDRATLSYILANKIESNLYIEMVNNRPYVAYKNKKKGKGSTPFHLLFTGVMKATFKDSNFLNISGDNFAILKGEN